MDAEKEDWKNIQSQFFSLYHLKLFNWAKGVVRSVDWQNRLLLNTVFHPIASTYHPPPLSYARAFFKAIITELEDEGSEIADELYEAYAQLMSRKDETDNEFCFKTYIIDSTNCVVLKESRNLVSNGTTGLCTWQASQYLCEWIADHKDIFRNRVVLELGSGLGLVGLVLVKLCQPTEVILSDCHDDVIHSLIDNIERNISKEEENEEDGEKEEEGKKEEEGEKEDEEEEKKEEDGRSEWLVNSSDGRLSVTDIGKQCKSLNGGIGQLERSLVHFNRSNVKVLKLNWETVSDESLEALAAQVDVILAADVVYDESIIPALVRNLSGLLLDERGESEVNRSQLRRRRRRRKMLLVCSTIRNSKTRHQFLSACRENGLQYEVMSDPVSQIFHYDRSTKIELLRLSACEEVVLPPSNSI